MPKYVSRDNDPLFKFKQWERNLDILEIDEITSIPFTPISHPFVERLIGTARGELLDHTLFWTSSDLQRKLDEFKVYFNDHRVHSSRFGTPIPDNNHKVADLSHYKWQSFLSWLIQTSFKFLKN